MANTFIWHHVSEDEKKEIQKEAKTVLDDFSKKLSKLPENKLKEPLIERQESEREENSSTAQEIDKKIMFSNAPKTNKENQTIVAEKMSWDN